MGVVGKTEWQNLNSKLRPLIKKTLYLPTGATNDYIHGSRVAGACDIPVAPELSDLCRMDSAFKLLTSKDAEIQEMARTAAQRTVEGRLRRPATSRDIADYLSGNGEGDFRAPATQLRSVWTEARKASQRMEVTWELQDEGPYITCGEVSLSPTQRKRLLVSLRQQLSKSRAQKLQSLPNQGKVMECVAADPASSHFIRTGAFTSFADWRFVHKARLNLLPLNGARPWQSNRDKRCRRCGFESETLAHVICHCMRQSTAMTGRHNGVVERIKKAASGRFSIMFENQPVGGTGLRPDLILQEGEEAIIVDVCCPFENRMEPLQHAREAKIPACERKPAETVSTHLGRGCRSWCPWILGPCQ
ncbi:uncharacterized protein LOC135372830 [Ornithodoros turicata]|uniref:uncharacterized protein LOC135372830 n=1 Tax=Ornithodoros turicata TaxID=34597 RepID=UPI00313A4461